MRRIIIFAILVFICSVSSGWAQIFQTPDTTFFQGFLTDSKGAPVEGVLPGKVTLYDANNAIVATVFDGSVQVVKGYFSIPLGYKTQNKSSLEVLFQAVTAEIEINGKAFNPRVYIGSVPIAKIAQVSDSTLRISDYAITDQKVALDAKIDGKKIIPDFGNQKIVTQDSVIGKEGYFSNSIKSKDAAFDTFSANLVTLKNMKADTITALKNLDVIGEITNSNSNSPVIFSDSVKIASDLNVEGNTNLNVLNAKDSATFRNGISITHGGIMSVGDSNVFKGNTTIHGDLFVDGYTNLKAVKFGDTQIDGNLTVNKAIHSKDSLIVQGYSNFSKDVKLEKNLDVSDSVHVRKNLTVDGKSSLNEGLNISGDLDVAGNSKFKKLTVTDSTNLNILNVSGASTLRDTKINGTSEITGKTKIGSDLDVTNKITTKYLEVTDSSSLKKTTVNGDLNVTNKIYTSKLAVSDSAQLGSGLITGNINVTGSMNVDGKITGKGKMILSPLVLDPSVYNPYSLYVDGKTYFKDGVLAGALTLNDSLTVNGITNLKKLNVSDSTKLNIVAVSGNSSLKNTSINGTLAVTGVTLLDSLYVNNGTGLNNTVINGNFNAKENANFNKDISVIGTSNLHKTNVTGSVIVSDTTDTKYLKVSNTANLNSGLITGDMNVTGKLNVDGKITGKGQMILSPTLTDPGTYQLYVDGNSYLKDVSIYGLLSINNMNVGNTGTFANIAVTNQSTLHNVSVDGTVNLPNNSIQYTEVESVDNAQKIRNTNIRKVDNVKDQFGIGPDKTHLHNLAIAIFRYMGNPGDKTYEGDIIYNQDGTIAVDNTVNSSSIIRNLITNNISSTTEKTTYLDSLFHGVTDITLDKNTTFKCDTITFQGDSVKIDAPTINLGCLNIASGIDLVLSKVDNCSRQMIIKSPTLNNPIFTGTLSLLPGTNMPNPNITGALNLSAVTISNFPSATTIPSPTITGSLNLTGVSVTWPSPLNFINPNIAGATYSGNQNFGTSTVDFSRATVTGLPTGTNYWTRSGNDIYCNNSGNVGIGRYPNYKLDVDGDLNVTGGIRIRNRIYGFDGITIGNHSDLRGDVTLGDDGDKTVRLTRYSNLDVVTGSYVYIHPGDLGSRSALRVEATTSNDYGAIYAANGNSSGFALYAQGNIKVTGRVSALNILNPSDSTLKTNIFPINSPLGKLLNLNGVYFNWKDTIKYDSKKHVGFIAQQVKEILPEVVHYDGSIYSVEYAPITALLVEAMKEQQHQIDSLRNRLTLLEDMALNSESERIEMEGNAKLIDGKVEIELKKEFKGLDYDKDVAFVLTPKGECNGLFVAKIENGKVTIKELAQGKSNISFYYSIKSLKTNPNNGLVIGSK